MEICSQILVREMIDRSIGKYICTISRKDKAIEEKTYKNKNGAMVYLISNIILKDHPVI